MNPAFDHALVAAIVLGAALFFARRFFGRKGKNCGGDCCGASKLSKPPIDGLPAGKKRV